MKIPGGFDALFRQLTPLLLLGVLVVVVAEPWLPGATWVRAHFGEQALLRVCVAALVCYVLILWGESLRLHTILTGVLQAFRQFRDSQAGGDGSGGGSGANAGRNAGRNAEAKREAARLLIAALRSDDASIRSSSRQNLARLAGEDHGDDPAAWQRWLERQSSRSD